MSSSPPARIVKIPANQSAPYFVGSNRVNVTIPRNNIVDMLHSFLELQVRVTTVDGDAGSGDGLYNVNLFYGSDKTKPLYTAGLIRNCRLSTDQLGVIEETQNVNLLRSTLNHLTLSRNEQASLQVNSTRQLYDRHKLKIGGLFRQLEGEGSVKSSNQLGRVPVPLSELFGLGRAEQVDLSKLGELDVEVELDIANINAEIIGKFEVSACADIAGDTALVELIAPYDAVRDIPYEVGDEVIFRHTSGSVNVGYKIIDNIALAGTTATITLNGTSGGALTNVTLQKVVNEEIEDVSGDTGTFQLKQKFERLDGCPFWVGQKVKCVKTNGSEDVNSGIITNISRDASTGIVSVTTDTTTGGAESGLHLEVFVPDATTSAISYEGLNAIVHQVMNKTIDDSGGYKIMTFQTERKNGNNNTSYNDTFTLPPMCINSYLMFDTGTLYSINDDVNSYRQVLNNNNLSDRPVNFEDPLYYDNVLKTIINGGRRLRCLQNVANADKVGVKNAENTDSTVLKIVSTPTPNTAQNKLLQINVEGTGTGTGNVICYKENIKVVGA